MKKKRKLYTLFLFFLFKLNNNTFFNSLVPSKQDLLKYI